MALKYVVSAMALAMVAGAAQAELVHVGANADLANGFVTSPAGMVSHRNLLNTNAAIAAGDTYGAAIIGQTTTTAAFMTATAGRVTSFTYDLSASVHGTLVGSGATVNMSETQTLIAPNVLRVVIAAFTADSSSLWVSGITAGTPAAPITQGRFDVGAGAFTNGLLWDDMPGTIASVSIVNAVFADGALLATSSALTNGRALPQMGTNVVWNGVVGSVVDETQMIFDITFIPAPGTAALAALGGLVATRRRR